MVSKKRFFTVRITEDQHKLLEAKANEAGFSKKSDFVRFTLFMPISTFRQIQETHEKIKEIYEKICSRKEPKSDS